MLGKQGIQIVPEMESGLQGGDDNSPIRQFANTVAAR